MHSQVPESDGLILLLPASGQSHRGPGDGAKVSETGTLWNPLEPSGPRATEISRGPGEAAEASETGTLWTKKDRRKGAGGEPLDSPFILVYREM